MPRILILDDEPDIGAVISRAASSVDFDPVVCTTPGDFWRSYETDEPDVIWMDMIVPEADGIEIVRELAERGCRAAIVLMTGNMPLYAEAAAKMGSAWGLRFSAILQKPARFDRIRRAITEALADVVDRSVPDSGLFDDRSGGGSRTAGRRG